MTTFISDERKAAIRARHIDSRAEHYRAEDARMKANGTYPIGHDGRDIEVMDAAHDLLNRTTVALIRAQLVDQEAAMIPDPNERGTALIRARDWPDFRAEAKAALPIIHLAKDTAARRGDLREVERLQGQSNILSAFLVLSILELSETQRAIAEEIIIEHLHHNFEVEDFEVEPPADLSPDLPDLPTKKGRYTPIVFGGLAANGRRTWHCESFTNRKDAAGNVLEYEGDLDAATGAGTCNCEARRRHNTCKHLARAWIEWKVWERSAGLPEEVEA